MTREKPIQRSVTISDQAWAATMAYAAEHSMKASAVCEQVMQNYLDSAEPPFVVARAESLNTRKRSIHISQPTWVAMMSKKVFVRRSISTILEQLLRQQVGLPAG
ncbi:MAG: hypothetical protein ACPG8W_09065 [Candidatus Promineifilaceae bacterium]